MRHARRCSIAALSAVVSLALPACSRGPEMARVNGTVTYDGKPLAKGRISFVSTDPARPNASSEIQPDGSYSLATRDADDGAQLGDYKVSVTGVARDEILDYIPKTKKAEASKSTVPPKYADPEKSELKTTVKSGRNTIPFDLK